MRNSKLILQSFLHTLGVVAYVAFVALAMNNGERFFGKMSHVIGGATFLLLFVLSAAITGALVLGRPILYYLDNKKTEAIKLFGFTLAWLFISILMIFLVQLPF